MLRVPGHPQAVLYERGRPEGRSLVLRPRAERGELRRWMCGSVASRPQMWDAVGAVPGEVVLPRVTSQV